MMIAFKKIFCFLVIVYSTSLYSQYNYPILNLGIDNGLSNNSVRCIYKDKHGFMWFGTYDGLNRYDGYEFKVFRNKLNDSTSLPHNYIYDISEDSSDNLWIGTGQGVAIYNPITSRFAPVYYKSLQRGSREKIINNITHISTDARGNTFIGTNGWGLYIKFKGHTDAVQIPFQFSSSPLNYGVQSIVCTGNLTWIFIQRYGLCLYDYNKNDIKIINAQLKNISKMIADGKGNIWISTSNGVYKYAIAKNIIAESYTDNSGQLTSAIAATLCVDKEDKVWIGTEGGGINIFDPTTHAFTYLLPGDGKNQLSSESVFAIYEDDESRKWIGTLKGGINIIDVGKTKFQTISHDPLQANTLAYNFVSAFFEDKDKYVWIGTDGGGFSIWNRQKHIFTNYVHRHDGNNSLSNNAVTSFLEDSQGNMWISTFGGGINKFDKTKNTFKQYKCINNVTGDENRNVWLLYEDHDKNVWATTFANGRLYKLNKTLDKFEVFDQEIGDLVSVFEDKKGNLWGGNSYQLIKIDRKDHKHIYYNINKPVRSIYEDSKGLFWVGTEGGGLVLFNRNKGTIAARYSEGEGLCNNSVLNILEDDHYNLWISTFNGLSAFDIKERSFRNFYQSDGLQSNQFTYSAAKRLYTGELVFGGIKGFNIFYPQYIQSRTYMPPVMITSIRINNNFVDENANYFKTSGNTISELIVPYNQAILTFNFAALEYSTPGKIKYAYYLEGWDNDWNYSNSRTVTYNNIREGDYILRIKSTNAAGEWNKKETILKITVLPPWFRTWWAYTLYFIAIIVAIYYYQQYRNKQHRLKYEVKLAQISAENEKQLSEKKISFFTNISHEFRTLLTLIVNPIKEIMHSSEYADKPDEIKTVYKNSRRMLALVDQLLLFRKADKGDVQLKISQVNVCDISKEVFDSFSYQAKTKNIQYEFVAANENIPLYIDYEKIEIAIFNLLSNAMKYTPENGKVTVSIKENDEKASITVSDTGKGFPEEIGNKIFNQYYQIETSEQNSKPGFGIGLYLVKNFIEQHHGSVKYETSKGKGTTFFIDLLKGKNHFGDEMIISQTTAADKEFIKEIIDVDYEVSKDPGVPSEPLQKLTDDKKTLLIIDDNEDICDYVQSIFKDAFHVIKAADGINGFQITSKQLPDIVITDLYMPGMQGDELCKKIKTNDKTNHIPVILLTASTSAEMKLKCIECGADDFISKPFEKDLLVARVNNLFNTKANLQKYFYNEITLQKNELEILEEDKIFLERCIEIVEEHMYDDQFAINILATNMGMSHSNLYKKIRHISGHSANGFVRFVRLRKAAELFINSDCNVNEAATQVGFNDVKYFRTQFTKLFQMPPSAYIKKYRKPFRKLYKIDEKAIKKITQ